jgi:hypothetical protein
VAEASAHAMPGVDDEPDPTAQLAAAMTGFKVKREF